MKKYIVIFFAFMLVLPALAQQPPSNEWVKHVREVVSASAAMTFTKGQVNGAVTPEKAPLDFWKKKIFETSQKMDLPGSFTILDPNNGYQEEVVSDTVLTVSVADLSLFWGVKDGVDVTDRKFLVPTHEVGTMKILKSYTSQQDAVASNEALAAMTAGDVQWIVKDSLFVVEMNGKEYMYKKDGSDWKLKDPEAPTTIKVGDRKKDPTFLFQGSDLLASNKRRTPSFLSNSYRFRPLTNSIFYSSYGSPYWGGGGWGGYGWNSGFGWGTGGCFGGGFSAGLSFSLGCSSFVPYNAYYCQPNLAGYNMDVVVWNRFTRQILPTTLGVSGYNYGQYCNKSLPASSGAEQYQNQVEAKNIKTSSEEVFVSLDKGVMDQFAQPQVIGSVSSDKVGESGNAQSDKFESLTGNKPVTDERFAGILSTSPSKGESLSDGNRGMLQTDERFVGILSTNAKPVKPSTDERFSGILSTNAKPVTPTPAPERKEPIHASNERSGDSVLPMRNNRSDFPVASNGDRGARTEGGRIDSRGGVSTGTNNRVDNPRSANGRTETVTEKPQERSNTNRGGAGAREANRDVKPVYPQSGGRGVSSPGRGGEPVNGNHLEGSSGARGGASVRTGSVRTGGRGNSQAPAKGAGARRR